MNQYFKVLEPLTTSVIVIQTVPTGFSKETLL